MHRKREFKWIKDNQGNIYCGNCKIRPPYHNWTPYCPCCGAKMSMDHELFADVKGIEDEEKVS